MDNEKMGEWAFILGVVIAVIVGAFSAWVQPWQGFLMALLALLGLVVGLLNVSSKEVDSFLIATIVLMVGATSIGSTFGVIGNLGTGIGQIVVGFVQALTAFVAPGAVLVALKSVYGLASKK
ncbi:hypothetical protein HZC08_00255 [Candidatus Micrarchaeota archaeon]|nr:hypothetical protein [Candidatus Micrarchaeota archaeon]